MASRARAAGVAPVTVPAPVVARSPFTAAAATAADMARGLPWQGVGWSLSLVGLLVYLWSAATYSVPLGEAGMIVALAGLLFVPGSVRLPGIVLLFVAYVAWSGLGYFSTAYPAPVTKRLDELVRVGLILLVVVNVLRTREQQRFFMFFFLAAFALYPARGTLVNYFIGGYNMSGRALWNYQYANSNDLAALTLLQLSLALAFLSREPKGWPRLAAIAGLFVLPLIILLTQSRGTIIALGVAGLLFLATQKRRLRSLAVAGLLGAALVAVAPDSVWQRLSGLRHATDTEQLASVDAEGSAEQRFEIWRVASAVFADHKLMGVGAGAYMSAHYDYSRRAGFAPTARGRRDAHSTYLTLLAETGIPGFVLFMSIIVGTLLKAERVRRRTRQLLPRTSQQLLCLELGILGFFVGGIFGSYAHLAMTNVYLALLWCVAQRSEEELRALTAGGASVRTPVNRAPVARPA